MTSDYIAIGVIIGCIGMVAYIAVKKFPVLSSINIPALQKHKQEKIKKGLIEDRLKRKLTALSLRNLFSRGRDKPKSPLLEKIYLYIKKVERQYQDKIRSEAPEEKEEAEKKKSILLSEADELAEAEKYKEAEDKYIEAISLDNKFTSAYEGLAETYFKMKDYDHAKEIYHFLLNINSKDDATYGGLGKIAVKKGDFEEAEKDYLKSISINNEVASYHIDLGDVYMATEEYERALACFKEAIKLEPNNPRNLDAIIEVAIKLKDINLASEYIKKLKEVNPENKRLEEFEKELSELGK